MKQNKYIAFIMPAILLCLAVQAVYPSYQYYVDPDATAYFTIIKRYLHGDLDKAVNGYWSPLSCWLTVHWRDISHWSLMASAVGLNTLAAVGFLAISHSFFKYFKVKAGLIWLCQLTLVGFLTYAVYGQLFDDLWECFFLLSALRIMLREDFIRNRGLWVGIGVLGAMAYYAKAYSFPFFILSTIVCTRYLIVDRKHWLNICAVSIGVMIACAFPWIYALHHKYGEWMIGTAGKLNLSWYTVGHPYWKEGITHLVPPVYADSPYYWEDPYLVNGAAPNMFSSFAVFKMQLMRIPYTLLKMMNSMGQLSVLFVPILLVIATVVFSKKARSYFREKLHVAGISFLLFPLAFILINFEARYLWYMLPISMVVGALLLQKLFDHFESKYLELVAVGIFALGYLYWPVLEMKKMYKVGAEDYRIAELMKAKGMQGSFTVIAEAGDEVQGIERIAYFSGNPFYAIPDARITHAELLSEMKRYGVKYYIHFYDPAEGDTYRFTDLQGAAVPELFRDEAYGIRVFGPLH